MARRYRRKSKGVPKNGSFVVQMNAIVSEVEDDVKEAMYEAMDKVTIEAVQRLKASSPRAPGGGRYAEGWTYEQRADSNVVYNATDYQLTHLLEYGHAVKPKPTHPGKKARVDARPHIKTVEQWANTEFENEISRLLS